MSERSRRMTDLALSVSFSMTCGWSWQHQDVPFKHEHHVLTLSAGILRNSSCFCFLTSLYAWVQSRGHTHGLKLRLYGGLLTMIWLSADTITRMRMGMTCTKRARPPCKRKHFSVLKMWTLQTTFQTYSYRWLNASPYCLTIQSHYLHISRLQAPSWWLTSRCRSLLSRLW